MKTLSLIVFGFIAFSNIGAVRQTPENFKIIFEGSLQCKPGSVKFSSGELAKQEFPNLNAAQDALNRVYVSNGIAELMGLFKDVCEEKEEDEPIHLGPPPRDGGPTTAEHRKPGSLVFFDKKRDLVTFRVFGFESELSPTNVAQMYMDKAKERCRKISSSCWKCPDGIVCSASQIAK
jgi:hypothetical protein